MGDNDGVGSWETAVGGAEVCCEDSDNCGGVGRIAGGAVSVGAGCVGSEGPDRLGMIVEPDPLFGRGGEAAGAGGASTGMGKAPAVAPVM